MAGWLSSKLKVAEQFLQQIDQQAAESLKRSDHETSLAFPLAEDSPRVHSQDLLNSNKNQYAKSAGVTTPEQGYFSSTKITAQQSMSNLRKNSGLYNDQPSLNKTDLDGQKTGTRKPGLTSPAEQAPGNSSKEDWTELLASPDLIGNFSASRASSVGSSDLGMSSTVRGVPSRSPFYSGKAQNYGAPSTSSSIPHAVKPQSRHSMRPSVQVQTTEIFFSDDAAGNEKFHGDPVRRYLNLDENSCQHGNSEFQDVLLEDAESSTEEGQSSRSRKRQADLDKHSCTVESGIDGTSYSGQELFSQGIADFKKKSDKHVDVVETQQSEEESSGLGISRFVNKDKNVGKTDSENHFLHSSLDHVTIPTEQQPGGFTSVRTQGLGQIASPSEAENLVHLNVFKTPVTENVEGLEKDDVKRNKKSLEIFSMQRVKVAENFEHDEVANDRVIPDCSISADNGVGNEVRSSKRGQNSSTGLEKDHESDTETETDSDTDSDYEENLHRLTAEKRRLVERKTAELAAAEAARAALREREEFIKRLEKERESLEHALAEREEKQAKEAEDLQTGMIELIEAVELEKQRHTTTRMESLAKEAKLEVENAQLAKTLAAAQRNLDKELSHLIQVRSKVDAQKVAKADLERKIAKLNSWISLSQLPPQAGDAVNTESGYGFVAEEKTEILSKINHCKVQVKDLEEKLANAKNVQQTPTDVEIELEHRLNQLTEHLIQKQAQVEELSTEKATLLFRLETLSNILQDQGSPLASHSTNSNKADAYDWSSIDEDLEYGASKLYSSKYKISNINRDDLHGNVLTKALINPHMLDAFYHRIDSLFLGGAHILRMHKLARALAGFYLLALHCWVLFILLMHSNSIREGSSIANSSQDLSLADSINVLNATSKS